MAAQETRALDDVTSSERQPRRLAWALALGLMAVAVAQLVTAPSGGASTPRAAILAMLVGAGVLGAYLLRGVEKRRGTAEAPRGVERACESPHEGTFADSAPEAHAVFEVVASQTPIGLAYFDRTLLCILVNDALTELDGLSIEQHRGRHVKDILPPPLGEAVAEDMLRVIETGAATNGLPVRVESRSRPGEMRNWVISYCPLRLANSEIKGVGCTIEDVTERLHTERERERLVVDLREAVRARDDFLSIASHELRTPLSTLALGTQELIRAADAGVTPTPAQLRKKAERLRSQVHRLERLIGTVLDVSRITQGRVRLFPEQLDASAVVRERCEQLRDDAARAGSYIELSCSEAIVGNFDRTRLEQIVDNLLCNAIKFGAGNSIEVTLESTLEIVRLTVHDHGVGIAKEDQARIFERFERAVSSRHYGGLGLGLWVVRQIVESMGGTIFVTSELGMGSTFVVEWPRVPA